MRTPGASSRIGRSRGKGLMRVELIGEMQRLDLCVRQRLLLAPRQPLTQLVALRQDQFQRSQQRVFSLEVVSLRGAAQLALDRLCERGEVLTGGAGAVKDDAIAPV